MRGWIHRFARVGVVIAVISLIAGAGAFTWAAPLQSSGKTVTLPRNSVNGLAAAIASAGAGGTVIVQSGLHFESVSVVIDIPVTILGKRGAVLVSTTTPGTFYPIVVDAALHIRGTSSVSIRGLQMRPAEGGAGNCGVLIEDSPDVEISGNQIDNYQFGVLNQRGDRAEISGNTISVYTGWQTGAVPEAHGIVNINGIGAKITDNVVSGALFGIWACHIGGRASGNSVSASFVGLILCKVPTDNFLISGSNLGSITPGAGWTVHGNFASGNDWGYLIIDGANNSTMTNNAGSGNAYYDMELTMDTYRFGFLTPGSFDNTVDAGRHDAFVIKNCGLNTTVTGGTLVDLTADPCY